MPEAVLQQRTTEVVSLKDMAKLGVVDIGYYYLVTLKRLSLDEIWKVVEYKVDKRGQSLLLIEVYSSRHIELRGDMEN